MNRKKIKKLLDDKNIRATKQRIEILKVLSENKIPLTAAEVNKLLLEKEIKIRLSTIYRNLNFFTDKNLTRKLNFITDEKKYELLAGQHHQHLICTKCGEILPIKCPLSDYEEKIQQETNYQIVRHDMELYGVCPDCQEN